eukprot:Em0013g235a
MSGPYAVTLVSSTPVFTVRVVVTATLALNGSKVTCEESSNGVAYTQIGNGYFYVQESRRCILAATIFKGVVEHLKENSLHETLSFAPPRPPNITTRSMGEGWMTVALIQSINGGVPSLFIVTINRTMSISVTAINGTAMVNLTGLSDCKAPYEISVTALNCAGNASDTIWSQLLYYHELLVLKDTSYMDRILSSISPTVPTSEGIPSTLIPTPTPYSSEHGVASQHFAVQVAGLVSVCHIEVHDASNLPQINFH